MSRNPKRPAKPPSPVKAPDKAPRDTRPVIAVLGTGQMGLVCAGMLVAGAAADLGGEGRRSGLHGRTRIHPVRSAVTRHN